MEKYHYVHTVVPEESPTHMVDGREALVVILVNVDPR